MKKFKERVYRGIWEQFKRSSDYSVDDKGYLCECKPEYNLISGLEMADFRDELEGGSGQELRCKFRAVHSSAALVVNTFGIWKNSPHTLELCKETGFDEITFEKKCRTVDRAKANIDLLAESEETVIGIESKFTEHLEYKLRKKRFPPSYNSKKLPDVEDKWWNIIENERKNEKEGKRQYLDVAQLMKHCIGLRNEFQNRNKHLNIILYYLFWEPKNWRDIPALKTHREETRSFAKQVENTSVRFKYDSYPKLWSKWETKPELEEHLNNLRSRYLLCI